MEQNAVEAGYGGMPEIEWGTGVTQHDLMTEIREIDPRWVYWEDEALTADGAVVPRLDKPAGHGGHLDAR